MASAQPASRADQGADGQEDWEAGRCRVWAFSSVAMLALHMVALALALTQHPPVRPAPPPVAMTVEMAPMPPRPEASAAPLPAQPAPVPPKAVEPAKPKATPRVKPVVRTPAAVPAVSSDVAEPIAAPSTAAVDAPVPAPPSAAPALAPVPASPQAIAHWHGRLQAHLESRKRYPRAAQSRRQEGVATIRFVMDRQGNVLAAELGQSAGHSLLDEECLDLLQRAQPLPLPPPEVKGERVEVSVPIEFFLK